MTQRPSISDDEVVRLTHLLSAAVRFSNITQREVERQLGLSSGSLSRLFSGGIELKVKHVLDVCDVIAFPPSLFFQAAYPQKGAPDATVRRLQRLLEQLHPDSEQLLSPAPSELLQPSPPTPSEVEQLIAAALAKYFSRLARTAPANGASE